MSDPKDVTRPRSPLALSRVTPRPQTPRDEIARKMYGNTAPKAAHAAALAKALQAGTSKPITDHAKALVGALGADSSQLSDDLTRYPGTDSLGRLDADAPLASLIFNPDSASSAPGSTLYSDSLALAALSETGVGPERFRRIKLARDRDRPLEFYGRIRAEVQELSFGGQVALRAAIYETRGGKFVAEMTRRETVEGVDYGTAKRPYLFAKATVFANLDLAAMSFRTQGGRLTERLLQQIGDVDSEFIE